MFACRPEPMKAYFPIPLQLMLKPPVATLLLFLIGLSASFGKSPNFVVILTDDQSWVGTSLQIIPNDERSKSHYFQTPHIERLANAGTRFTQGYAPAPYCCPTRRSLLIGQTPARHIYQKDQANWTKAYRQQLSIPRMLKTADPRYRSAHFGKWDMRFDDVTPEEMGYDESDGLTSNGTGGGKGSGGPSAKDDPKLIWEITEKAKAFMKAQSKAERPFYLQVSHYAVHLDIFYRQETLKAVEDWTAEERHDFPAFAAMTHDMDTGIGLLLDQIEALGIERNTYIFFMSDNGGREGYPSHPQSKSPLNYPLRDGKGSMYEGGIRVPFIVAGPGVDAGAFSDAAVTGLDILPTLADLSGYSKALPRSLDGGSLKPLLIDRNATTVQRNNSFLVFHQAAARSAESAIIEGDFKLVKTWASNRLELFDLSKDLSEANNLALRFPEKTDKLHRMLVGFLDQVKAETRKIGSKSEVYQLSE